MKKETIPPCLPVEGQGKLDATSPVQRALGSPTLCRPQEKGTPCQKIRQGGGYVHRTMVPFLEGLWAGEAIFPN